MGGFWTYFPPECSHVYGQIWRQGIFGCYAFSTHIPGTSSDKISTEAWLLAGGCRGDHAKKIPGSSSGMRQLIMVTFLCDACYKDVWFVMIHDDDDDDDDDMCIYYFLRSVQHKLSLDMCEFQFPCSIPRPRRVEGSTTSTSPAELFNLLRWIFLKFDLLWGLQVAPIFNLFLRSLTKLSCFLPAREVKLAH